MAITGHLAEFSLAEIFQFLEQGHKSGLLMVTPMPEPPEVSNPRSYYVWLQQGRIVAASNRSDHKGLLNLISQRGLLGNHAASRLAQTCDLKGPLGLCFKARGVLQGDHLKLLFYTQVMQQVCALFSLEDGWFHFDSNQKAPPQEMTGLSAPAVEVTLAGLRALKNWTVLADKLPDPSSSLVSTTAGKPSLKLNQSEWQVWEFTDGKTSLKEIAQHLRLPLEKVQQIAFRLIVVSLVEELPMSAIDTLEPVSQPEPVATLERDANLSTSFLQNLMGFLKGQS